MFLVKEEILLCLNLFCQSLTVVGMTGDGEEFWIHHNLYYYLIFKFVGTEIWEGRIQLFLISNIDICGDINRYKKQRKKTTENSFVQ